MTAQQPHRLGETRQGLGELRALAHAIAAHPGQHQHLREFGDLEIHRADAHPTSRAVDRRAEAGDQHQQQQQEAEHQQRQAVLVPPQHRDARDHPRAQHADQAESELALEEVERIAEILGGDRHRGRGDHDQPDEQQCGHQAERDGVPRERHALARPHSIGHGGGVHGARPCKRANRSGEDVAAMPVIAKHVEACARGRQQHGVARAGGGRGGGHRGLERRGPLGRAHAAQRRLEGGRILADQHHMPHLVLECRGERREVLALAFAAGDHHQRTRHARDRRDGRADVRALRVIDVAHAGDVGDPGRAVLEPRESFERREHGGQFEPDRLSERERRQARWPHCAVR